MKLVDKLKALLRSKAATSVASRPQVSIPKQRPTPPTGQNLPQGWSFYLEPAAQAQQVIGEFVEQLALEAYLNGPAFQFSDEELTGRFQVYFDRLVGRDELQRVEVQADGGRAQRWIQAQQIQIAKLITWWQAHGGPDIEPRVL